MPTTPISVNPTTAKGDILSFDGSSRSRVAVGTNGQILTARSTATSGFQYESVSISSPKFEYISTVSLTANAATVTFSSIPTTYKWLRVFGSTNSTSTSGAQPIIVLNANTTKTYYHHSHYRNGATVTTSWSNQTGGRYVAEIGSVGEGQVFVADIACNTTTNHETTLNIRCADNQYTNSNTRWTVQTAHVLLGDSITSILLKNVSTDVFGSGSVFELFGRKA